MTFLWILFFAVVLVVVLKKPIKSHPMVFYVIAIAIDVMFVLSAYISFPRFVSSALILFVQKCTFSLALFTIVMFIGVFRDGSRIKGYLLPVRAELSIIAWILSLGHMVMYLMSYLPQVSYGIEHMSPATLSALAVALVLFALLLVLGVTSFSFVKRTMKLVTWKRVQMLAYPFFILVYAHLLLMLLPAALKGGIAAQASVVVYSVIFIGYIVLRLYRAFKDRSARAEASAAADSQAD